MTAEHDASTERTRHVRQKAARMASARRSKTSLWRSVVAGGTVGWAFIIPTVVGVALGRLVARLGGFAPATLIGLGAGLAVGGFAVYWNVRRSLGDDDEEQAP